MATRNVICSIATDLNSFMDIHPLSLSSSLFHQGTHTELMARRGAYYTLVHSQQLVEPENGGGDRRPSESDRSPPGDKGNPSGGLPLEADLSPNALCEVVVKRDVTQSCSIIVHEV